ncbi:MAG: hypothetical protein ABIV51_00800 [Saprospiraceae bacterium]
MASAQFNGNISSMLSQVKGRTTQAYGLTYDNLNRLRVSTFADVNGLGGYTDDNKYGENITYADAIGDIATLKRWGIVYIGLCRDKPIYGVVDQLNYVTTYKADMTSILSKVEDVSGSDRIFKPVTSNYTYDGISRLVADSGNGMSIAYNGIALPATISSNNGSTQYVYDLEGKLITKIVSGAGSENGTYSYIGSFIFKGSDLESYNHEEGRITYSGGQLHKQWFSHDHLGNVRVVYEDLNINNLITENEILQVNNFYPFGSRFDEVTIPPASMSNNRLKYNEKEEQLAELN